MATEDLDVVKLVDTIEAMGKDIEESNQVFNCSHTELTSWAVGRSVE